MSKNVVVDSPLTTDSSQDENVENLSRQALNLSLERNESDGNQRDELNSDSVSNEPDESTPESVRSDAPFLTPPELTLERINQCLNLLNIQHVSKQKLQSSPFRIRKINEIITTFKQAFNKIVGLDAETEGECL